MLFRSIKNFKKITKHCLEFVEKTGEYILDRALLEKIYELDLEEIEEYLAEYTKKIENNEYPKNHRRYKISAFKYKNEFISHIKSDLKLFDLISSHLSSLDLVKK